MIQKKNKLVRSLIITITVLLGVFIVWWLFESFLKIPIIPFLKQNHFILKEFVERFYIAAVLLFCLSYTIFTFVCLPGSSLFMVAGGFVFGLYVAPLLIITSVTIGSCLLLVALRAGLHTLMKKVTHAHPVVQKIIREFDHQGALYLIVLRLTGFIPVSVTNIALSLTHIKLSQFLLGTFFGLVPIATSYTLIGVSAAHAAACQGGSGWYLQGAAVLFISSKCLAGFLLFVRYLFRFKNF